MLFRLESEAYEEERIATMANRTPTTGEQESEPATTNTSEARQEGFVPADTNPTLNQQPVITTLPEPVPTNDTP